MNQIDLTGRVAAVTGGTRGIGLAIAQRMLNPARASRCGIESAPRRTAPRRPRARS
jgi:NAD(P)-dependent dehydrogenase (short-subunit alcohol dehydrogenase family)